MALVRPRMAPLAARQEILRRGNAFPPDPGAADIRKQDMQYVLGSQRVIHIAAARVAPH